MKHLIYLLLIGTIVLSCSNDLIEFETVDVKAQLPPVENANPVFFDDGTPFEFKVQESLKEPFGLDLLFKIL